MRVLGAIALLASLACIANAGCAVATGDGEAEGAAEPSPNATSTATGSASNGAGAGSSATGDSITQSPTTKTASIGDPDRPPPHPWMTAGSVPQATTNPSNPAPAAQAR